VKNQKNIQKSRNEISKKYNLCKFCSSRLKLKKTTATLQTCFICKNIFRQVDELVRRVFEDVSSYEFSNFETGSVLKSSLIDKDDYIKSEFQIKGVSSIKTNLNNVIAKKLAFKTKRKINHKNPDLTIKINFKDDSYEIHSKSLIIYGRYIKKSRELVQKQHSCRNCSGKGCYSCNFHGLDNFNSIEGKIAKFFIEKFDCQQVKINWLGGEEKSSLVIGNGRPFFAKITNPKKRKRLLRRGIKLDGIELVELRKILELPKGQIFFKSKLVILVKTEEHIKSSILNNLKKLKMPLEIRIDGNKPTLKKIYKINFKKISSNLLKIHIYADGGLPIKSFIQNTIVFPNLAYLLKNQCKCVQFDFKKIDVMS